MSHTCPSCGQPWQPYEISVGAHTCSGHQPAIVDPRDATIAALRAIISKVATNIGNGSVCSPDCSLEFMATVPEEVRLVIAALRAELAEARKKADEYDAMMACIADEDVRLMVSKASDENTGDMVTVEQWFEEPKGHWDTTADFPTFAQARAFLARKETP